MSDRATQVSAEITSAVEVADGLRELATMVTNYPQLVMHLRYVFNRLHVPVGAGDGTARGGILAFARAGVGSGATVTEHDDGKWAGVNVAFGPVTLHVYADVAKVHDVTRIVEYTPRSILAEIEDTQ